MSNFKESSLTTPTDRISTKENPWIPDKKAPSLTDKETTEAVKDLNITVFIDKFPKVERNYIDPPPLNQNIGLISFIPSKGATPDKNGLFGFAKLRGNYATELEANQRAEFLIRNTDSYHKIYHTYVGRPFPITESSDYSATVDEIDLHKQVSETISADIKAKKQSEKRAMTDIKEREDELLAESERAKKDEPNEDPYENYITLRVKKAQLTWTYKEHQKKMAEVKDILVDTRKSIEELDETYPTYKDKYFDKYVKARESAGLSVEVLEDNFMKFMVEDCIIPEVEELYKEKYPL